MSSDTLHAMINAPDKGIPEEVIADAKCIVIVPHLIKGGFIIGAEHGRGISTSCWATRCAGPWRSSPISSP